MISPGNAILLNGVAQFANRDIGVPGVQRTGSAESIVSLWHISRIVALRSFF
jgi:hypothetical protein